MILPLNYSLNLSGVQDDNTIIYNITNFIRDLYLLQNFGILKFSTARVISFIATILKRKEEETVYIFKIY